MRCARMKDTFYDRAEENYEGRLTRSVIFNAAENSPPAWSSVAAR